MANLSDAPGGRTKKDATEQRKKIEARLKQEEIERQKAIEGREQFYGLQVEPDVEYYEEIKHRTPGDTNWVGYGFDIHPQVTFVASGLLIVSLLGHCLLASKHRPYLATS